MKNGYITILLIKALNILITQGAKRWPLSWTGGVAMALWLPESSTDETVFEQMYMDPEMVA